MGNTLNFKTMEHDIDLFENQQTLPNELQEIIKRYNDISESEGMDYIKCESFLQEVIQLGYTFEYELDAVPFNLQRL